MNKGVSEGGDKLRRRASAKVMHKIKIIKRKGGIENE